MIGPQLDIQHHQTNETCWRSTRVFFPFTSSVLSPLVASYHFHCLRTSSGKAAVRQQTTGVRACLQGYPRPIQRPFSVCTVYEPLTSFPILHVFNLLADADYELADADPQPFDRDRRGTTQERRMVCSERPSLTEASVALFAMVLVRSKRLTTFGFSSFLPPSTLDVLSDPPRDRAQPRI